MKDVHTSYSSLQSHEKEGIDFAIEIKDRDSMYAILAIHGGNIEPETSEIARAIAGEEFSYYSFVGLKEVGTEEELHITSTRFDEPRCLELVAKCGKVVAVHGKYEEKEQFVMVGGLDTDLVRTIELELRTAGFEVLKANEGVNGNSPQNICNRCVSGKGIQLEISRGLRDIFAMDPIRLEIFSTTIRGILLGA